jgi:hypothetical protein
MEIEKPKIEFSKRNSVFTTLKPFCHMAKENDFIEVTQWSNYEGFDIQISDVSGTRTIFMTDGEFTALKKLVKSLDKEIDREFNKKLKERD